MIFLCSPFSPNDLEIYNEIIGGGLFSFAGGGPPGPDRRQGIGSSPLGAFNAPDFAWFDAAQGEGLLGALG